MKKGRSIIIIHLSVLVIVLLNHLVFGKGTTSDHKASRRFLRLEGFRACQRF
ncbi:hypothetical protein ACFQ88_06550 [Paenibacillus sp. NPDC056579]|uniref:hypothetical protein n=1 Tax=Paenibacillus sp. NPDC056579 TaxID=3345871 RepID=UPI0036C4C4E2